MKNIINNFKLWLKVKKYHPNTIRNYLADMYKYFRYLKKQDNQNAFSETNISSYILFILPLKNSRRYLTSLAKFNQFAFESNLTAHNSFKKIRKQLIHHRSITYDSILQLYHKYLNYKHKTPVTIKNYINDVQQYLDFFQKQTLKLEAIFTPDQFNNYKYYLFNHGLSNSSVKRKLSSLSSFQKFLIKKKFIFNPPFSREEVHKSEQESFVKSNFIGKIKQIFTPYQSDKPPA